MAKYKRLIIDGNNMLYRAIFQRTKRVNVDEINTVDGAVINTFLKMIISSMEHYGEYGTVMYVSWDKKLSDLPSFRKNLVDYKGQRKDTPISKILHNHIECITDILHSMGVHVILPYTTEADDVICFLSTLEPREKTLIISADTDLLQLVDDYVDVNIPNKYTFTLNNFKEQYMVDLSHYVLYKAIVGDSADNIPGLFRYGPVKAKQLVEEIGEYANIASSELLDSSQKDIIIRNIKLMDLRIAKQFIPNDYEVFKDQLINSPAKFDTDRLRELFETHKLVTINRKFGQVNQLFNTNFLECDLLDQICM